MTAVNIEHVIKLLKPTNSDKPITKKEACSILNISYNTSRLDKILEEYLEEKQYRDKRKAENRGKPPSKYETVTSIERFLEGAPISDISRALYRSPAFVNGIIERAGVPQKRSKEEKKGYQYSYYMLPDECVKTSFRDGEIAWSAVHDRAVEVMKEDTRIDYEAKYGSKCYEIYVYEYVEWTPDMYVSGWIGPRKMGERSFVLAYDLGSLEHLKEIGVTVG